jgi:YD repeat-containing protein
MPQAPQRSFVAAVERCDRRRIVIPARDAREGSDRHAVGQRTERVLRGRADGHDAVALRIHERERPQKSRQPPRCRCTAITVAGANTVAIKAVDPSGNVTNVQYSVTLNGSSRTFSYDANGNMNSDGTRTFEWDTRNQLVAVNVGTHRSEFAYDGKQRRVRVVEKEGGVTQTDTRVVWCEERICEERAADGVTVARRAFALGEQVAGTAKYFTTDHLGSIDVWLTQYRGYDAGLMMIASDQKTDVGRSASICFHRQVATCRRRNFVECYRKCMKGL